MLAKAVFRVHERLGEGRWDFTLKQALRCTTRMGLCTTWSDCVLSTAVGDRSIKMWSTRPLADPAAMCASFWVASAELSSTNAHPQNWGTRGTESQAKGQLLGFCLNLSVLNLVAWGCYGEAPGVYKTCPHDLITSSTNEGRLYKHGIYSRSVAIGHL